MTGRLFDYVIVGGGTAGCVIAARLAADRSRTVLLLEAGGRDGNPMIGVPGANVVTGTMPAINWNDASEPAEALGGRSLYWAQGRVLGGSGSINGMMHARGRPEDYDGWQAAGCPGWGHEAVLPYFRRAETHWRGPSRLHGSRGPLKVGRGRATAPICDLLLAAAREKGVAIADDFADAPAEAFGHVDLCIGEGRRSSTASAYLRGLRPGPNLVVRTRAVATSLIFEGSRAAGVKFRVGGRHEIVGARREVILCAGAINSPELLLRSGIGPAGELQALGVPVRADAPEVGRNLQNHPMYRLMYSCSKPVTAYSHVQWPGALRAAAAYVLARRGPLASGLFPTAGFLQAIPGDPESLVQICMAPALVIRRRPGVFGVLPQRHGFTLLLNQCLPYSRGRVTLRSTDPGERPVIAHGYFSDERDIDVLAAGVARMRDLMQAPSLKEVIEAEIQPVGPITGPDALKVDIRATCVTHYHAAGTCRMGADARSVVDPELRVRGLEGLRVADASIMPRLIRGSTFAPTVMIAERASDFIMGRQV